MTFTVLCSGDMEFLRTVTKPGIQTAPCSQIQGLKDDFGSIIEDVILVEGETHVGRKPICN